MRFERLQHRFLVAMGLCAPVILACSKKAEPDPTTATASASATGLALPLASASASAVPLATTPFGVSGGGGCGFVVVCEDAKKPPPPAQHAAAAPYEKCATTIPEVPTGDGPHRAGVFDEELTKQNRATNTSTCCYKASRMFCGGGRPLRGADGGPPIVAPSIARSDWSDRALADRPLPGDLQEEDHDDDASIRERWLRDAAFEHASIASFSRAAVQLLALGAPPELVRATHYAALDEIEHARALYALAERRGHGSAARGPGPLAVDRAPLAVTFAAFVRDTFLDGCVEETAAAIDVRARATDALVCDDVEREVLLRIADEEDGHAELAWRMLAWGVRAGGDEARVALEDAIVEVQAAAMTGTLVRSSPRTSDEVATTIALPCARALLDSATSRTTSRQEDDLSLLERSL